MFYLQKLKSVRIYAVIIISVFFTFFNVHELNAKGGSGDFYRKGQLFIEIGVGSGYVDSSALRKFENDTTVYNVSILDITSTNVNRQLFGMYILNSVGQQEQKLINGRLGFEYAFSDYFGAGISVQSSKIRMNNVFIFSDYTFLGVLLGGTSGDLNLFDLITAARGNVRMEDLSTADFNLSFHFLGSKSLDPFLRLSTGAGSVVGGYIIKGGGSLGIRYRAASSIFLFMEAYDNAMFLYYPGQSSTSSSSNVKLNESGARAGIGFTI